VVLVPLLRSCECSLHARVRLCITFSSARCGRRPTRAFAQTRSRATRGFADLRVPACGTRARVRGGREKRLTRIEPVNDALAPEAPRRKRPYRTTLRMYNGNLPPSPETLNERCRLCGRCAGTRAKANERKQRKRPVKAEGPVKSRFRRNKIIIASLRVTRGFIKPSPALISLLLSVIRKHGIESRWHCAISPLRQRAISGMPANGDTPGIKEREKEFSNADILGNKRIPSGGRETASGRVNITRRNFHVGRTERSWNNRDGVSRFPVPPPIAFANLSGYAEQWTAAYSLLGIRRQG